MSVVKCLGVDDVDGPQMLEVRTRWPQWCEVEPALGRVDDLVVLPRAMRQSEPRQRDEVLAALLRLGVVEPSATVALVWLLTPGATKLAWRLRDLSNDIDELVAGQVWIQARNYNPEDARYVAAKILNRTEREVMAELGIGDLAKRRDPTWARAVLIDRFDESMPDCDHGGASDEDMAREELQRLLRKALDSGTLSDVDRDLLLDLAHAANMLNAPLRRGRAGLTTPSVAERVSDDHKLAARTIRRHAADALDGLAEIAHPRGVAM
jgi:hypothetical protein